MCVASNSVVEGQICYRCNDGLSLLTETSDQGGGRTCANPADLDGDDTLISLVMGSVDLAMVLAGLGVCIWLTVRDSKRLKASKKQDELDAHSSFGTSNEEDREEEPKEQ
eukprot:gnl/Chilomastix_caulleri/1886.p1 GENE.gnl/Chilomastix_caulleri/1886~~gnl/Chilomastix_caulleri/1886.p1  ORF type:complete len:110 (-),score=33.79 gnl/Chilomastix_caulleri/1886:115-444(-)